MKPTLPLGLALALLLAACAPAAAPSPTATPSKAIEAAKPATTAAPAKPAEAKPAAKPTEKPQAKAEPKPAAKAEADDDLAKLIEAAKAEGELNLYSVQSGADLKRSDPEFQQMYPFLKMNRFRSEGEKLGAKLIEEARAGQYVADILDVDQNVTNAVSREGLLLEYDPPERRTFDAQMKRPTFTAYRIQLKPIAYNTRLVPKDQAPKGYEDLLDPKWRGKIVMESDEVSVFGATIQLWGQDKAVEYWKKLTANGLQFRSGQSNIIQLLAAGEFPVAVAANLHSIEQERPKGAPMDWVNTRPMFGNFGAVSIPKRAPHPNAAKLWVRYILSKNGQEAVAETGRVPANPAIKPIHKRLVDEGFEMHLAGDLVMNEYERINKLFYETTGRPFVQ